MVTANDEQLECQCYWGNGVIPPPWLIEIELRAYAVSNATSWRLRREETAVRTYHHVLTPFSGMGSFFLFDDSFTAALCWVRTVDCDETLAVGIGRSELWGKALFSTPIEF